MGTSKRPVASCEGLKRPQPEQRLGHPDPCLHLPHTHTTVYIIMAPLTVLPADVLPYPSRFHLIWQHLYHRTTARMERSYWRYVDRQTDGPDLIDYFGPFCPGVFNPSLRLLTSSHFGFSFQGPAAKSCQVGLSSAVGLIKSKTNSRFPRLGVAGGPAACCVV